MRSFSRSSARPTALVAAAAGAAGLLLLTQPLRGQQGPFSLQASIPATASKAPTTDAQYSFPLPPGLQLRWNPRVRVTTPDGQLEELLPMYVDRQSPLWRGHRGLHTANYRPGSYRVSIEVDYTQPGGGRGTVTTPPTTLIVPTR